MTCTKHKHCISNALQAGNDICRRNSLRFTDTRRQVLEIIWENHKPAKAYDILYKLKTSKGVVQPPTIYRALNFLEGNGLIHRINSLNAYIGCSHPSEYQHCNFLICTDCEEIIECHNPALNKAISSTANSNHFSFQNACVEIQGICKQCKDRQ